MDVSDLVAIDVHTHVHRSVNAPAGSAPGASLNAMAEDNAARLLGLA